MRVGIIGAGPAGLFTGTALARRGHDVTVIDRDPGPAPDGSWARRGVMQFHHPHGFRAQVAHALMAEMPEAYDEWLAAGAEPVSAPHDGRDNVLFGVRSRRATFETAIQATALKQNGMSFVQGHVDGVVVAQGRAAGLTVDGSPIEVDLVIDASGRSGRATRPLRSAPVVGGHCATAYVGRQYQLHPGANLGPLTSPITFQANFDGYSVIVIPHEHNIFSTLIVRLAADRDLVSLRHEAAFDAAAQAIPPFEKWTNPDHARPITPVLPGGTLMNVYRSQRRPDGRPILPGLVLLGDAVCTTTPNFVRGVATTMMQCVEFLRLFDDESPRAGDDLSGLGLQFDAWCEANMRPWVEDHAQMDAATSRRWDGGDIDFATPLPSDLIIEAAKVDPSIKPAIEPYLMMTAGPSSLRAKEPEARAVYETGWRPSPAPGPDRVELAAIVRSATR